MRDHSDCVPHRQSGLVCLLCGLARGQGRIGALSQVQRRPEGCKKKFCPNLWNEQQECLPQLLCVRARCIEQRRVYFQVNGTCYGLAGCGQDIGKQSRQIYTIATHIGRGDYWTPPPLDLAGVTALRESSATPRVFTPWELDALFAIISLLLWILTFLL